LALPEQVGQDAILMMRMDSVELSEVDLLFVTDFMVSLLG
jgi:hypothetical protein